MEINASFVIVILCQINSLLQEKDHFNKTTIPMIIVCMPFISSCLQNEHFPANRNFLRHFTNLAKFLLITDFFA